MALVTSQAAQLLAHTPSTVTPGCEQACTGSILCSVLTGAIRTASLHPSIQVLFPFPLITSLAAAQERGSCGARQAGGVTAAE